MVLQITSFYVYFRRHWKLSRGGCIDYTLGMIITIDGPAGSGKSTAARNLAAKLAIAYLDTGATYRAVTLRALRCRIDMKDEAALTQIARQMDLQMHSTPDGLSVLMDGNDVTDEIRSHEVTENVHYIASCPSVREVLVDLQRCLGAQLGDFVTEGRDQGSVVFDEADIKFFLIADPSERTRRRHEEMQASGQDVGLDEVHDTIMQRDERDRTRSVAPLIKPTGAIEVDTTNNTIDETTDELFRLVEAAK